SVSGLIVKGTPQRLPGEHEYHELPPELQVRRRKLARALEKVGTPLAFEELLEKLELLSDFDRFEKSARAVFDKCAANVPVAQPLRNGDNILEDDYVRCFFDLYDMLELELANSRLATRFRASPYFVMDKQNAPVHRSTLKPDVVFVFDLTDAPDFSDLFLVLEAKRESGKNAYLKYIGQIADYALALRECQPVRKYIPVLFLHGNYLDILVFSHRGYYHAPLGPVLYQHERDRKSLARQKTVAKSISCLWYLLTLSADQFGFMFNSSRIPTRLRFATRTIPASMMDASKAAGDDVVHVGKPISRSVQITGRCTHLYEATYQGRVAVLKFSSIPTNRLPEGAVYAVLGSYGAPQTDSGNRGVPNVPQIFASGNIVCEFDSYRLEFLVMEHCGTSVVDHIQSVLDTKDTRSQAAAQAGLYVQQVTSTLAVALTAGVLHRDISAGNLAVKDGKAFVIDWGYAKLLGRPTDEDFSTEIATRWSFDWDEVLAVEKAKDPFTGTPLYMSARLLLGSKMRGIYDDLESLFYVFLDAFSGRTRIARDKNMSNKPKPQPPGFAFHCSETAALTRLTCMQSSKCFLAKFGVVADSDSVPQNMLDSMRRFLFFDDGNHLGEKILDKEDFPRVFDHSAALVFMGEKTSQDLFSLVREGGDGRQVAQSPLQLDQDGDALPTRIDPYKSNLASTTPADSTALAAPPLFPIRSATQGKTNFAGSSAGPILGGTSNNPSSPSPAGPTTHLNRTPTRLSTPSRPVLRSRTATRGVADQNMPPMDRMNANRGNRPAVTRKRDTVTQPGVSSQQLAKRQRK
ncbi:hypothetical protein GGI24_002641, partial [Coemansia furcata]